MENIKTRKSLVVLPILIFSFFSLAQTPAKILSANNNGVNSNEIKTNAANNDQANQVANINVPMLADAHVFANYTNKLPAVVNYFTAASKNDIIKFYQNSYGDILSQTLKRKRLTLTFIKNSQAIRVVISSQNNQRQVDVIITQSYTNFIN